MTAKAPTLRVNDLCVRRGGREVLRGVSIQADRGLLVLAGPNGAGKTSLLRVLATLDPSFSGSIEIAGFDISRRRGQRSARSLIGYLPQGGSFPTHFSVADAVEYSAWLSKIASAYRRPAVVAALARFGIEALAERRLDRLSAGERQMVFLAQATVHLPRVLLLDEPSTAVDAEHRVRMRGALREWALDRLVVLATHLVEEIELLGDRIVVLNNGRVSFDGKRSRLLTLGDSCQASDYERRIETALRLLAEQGSDQ